MRMTRQSSFVAILQKKQQAELEEVGKWCHDNGTVINGSKTKLMHIRSPMYPESQNVLKNFRCNNTLEQGSIQVVDTYKYLSITIDCHFLWEPHINILRSKLRGSLFALACLQCKAPYSVQKQVYHALIESRLRYGVLAWGGAAQTHIDKLQRIQDSAVKMLSRRSPTSAEVLNVRQIFKLSIAVEYYEDTNFRTPRTHPFCTRRRAEGLIQLPPIINEYGRRRLMYNVPNTLNNLPQHLRNIASTSTRKRKLKKFFLEDIT